MKKLVLVMMVLMLPLLVFNQSLLQSSYTVNEKAASRNGTTLLPWLLTGGGVVMLVTGISMHGSKQSYVPNEEIGTALIIAGSASLVTGIVLFSSSAKCRAAEKTMSMKIKMEAAGKMEVNQSTTGIATCYYPALSFRVGL